MFRFLNMALLLALTVGFHAPIRTPTSKFSLSKVVMMAGEEEAKAEYLAPAAAWRAKISTSAPSSEAQLPANVEAQLPANVQGEETPYVESWVSPRDAFCFGIGGEPLSAAPAIDGSRAMSITSLLTGPPASSSVAQLSAKVKGGMVKVVPNVENSATPRDTFCYGIGGAPLSAIPAIDGSRAMSVTSMLTGSSASSSVARLPLKVRRALATPKGMSWARPSDEFRHGAGGASLMAEPAIDGSRAMTLLQ